MTEKRFRGGITKETFLRTTTSIQKRREDLEKAERRKTRTAGLVNQMLLSEDNLERAVHGELTGDRLLDAAYCLAQGVSHMSGAQSWNREWSEFVIPIYEDLVGARESLEDPETRSPILYDSSGGTTPNQGKFPIYIIKSENPKLEVEFNHARAKPEGPEGLIHHPEMAPIISLSWSSGTFEELRTNKTAPSEGFNEVEGVRELDITAYFNPKIDINGLARKARAGKGAGRNALMGLCIGTLNCLRYANRREAAAEGTTSTIASGNHRRISMHVRQAVRRT